MCKQVTSSNCTLLRLTLDNLLRVVDKELAERRPLWPLERVEQLLDLGGHSAVDRHAWTKTHGHKHAVTDTCLARSRRCVLTHTCTFYSNTETSLSNHRIHPRAGTSTQEPGSESAAGKD